MRVTKKVSFADFDKKSKAELEELEEDCPYRWIAEDTLYLRQYGHHLEKNKEVNLYDIFEDKKPVEPRGDLCQGDYSYPCYTHIPGGYRQSSEISSATDKRVSDMYNFLAYCDSSSIYLDGWKSDDHEDKNGSTAKKKSFLPPIDPKIISVKKKYGLMWDRNRKFKKMLWHIQIFQPLQ